MNREHSTAVFDNRRRCGIDFRLFHRASLKRRLLLLSVLLLQAVPVSAQDLAWARAMGGTDFDQATGVAVDGSGNVYTAGMFQDTGDFDPGNATFNLTSAGQSDIFISKLDSNGNFVWARRVGGTEYDEPTGIAVDSSGNVYTTGNFAGTVDFDPGAGTFDLVSPGLAGTFISKLDSNGNFVWARQLGGSNFIDVVRAYGIAVDSSGNVFTTGLFFGSPDFDPGPGTSTLTSAGSGLFVTKLNSNGDFLWASGMSGAGQNQANKIVVDGSGNIHIAGFFSGSVDFDPGPGTFELTPAGNIEAFVCKLNSSGNLVWARATSGTNLTLATGLAVDSSGNVYTAGNFYDTVDFDPGAGVFELTSAGGSDVFISKLNSNGNFVWARGVGGTGLEEAHNLSVDGPGNVYTTGFFVGTVDFNPGVGVFNLTSAGSLTAFVSKLSRDGDFLWARAMGRSSVGYANAVDSSGNVYTAGSFSLQGDFDPGDGTFNLATNGSADVFVSKLFQNGPPTANAGPDQTLSATGPGPVAVTLNGSGSSDPDDDVLTYAWSGPFGTVSGVNPTVQIPGGMHTVTLTVEDGRGGINTDTVNITVLSPPIANAGPDQQWSAAGPEGVTVTLNGSGSSDPNGDPLTYAWSGLFGTVSGVNPTVHFPGGVHTVTLTINDGKGGIDTDTVTITVLTVVVSPSKLTFSVLEGSGATTQTFTVRALGGKVAYGIDRTVGWLKVNPPSGESSGEVDTISVIVDPGVRRPGTYAGSLMVNGPGVIKQSVQVALMVIAPVPPPAPRPKPFANGVVDTADFLPFGSVGHAMAAQSWVSIYGTDFVAEGEFHAKSLPLPTMLGGTVVTFDGIEGPLLLVTPGLILVQLPGGVTPPTATILVQNNAGVSEAQEVSIAAHSPGIFTLDQNGLGQAIVVHAGTADLAAPVGAVGNSRPAAEGDYLTIYANGLGTVDPPLENGRNACMPDGVCLPDGSNVVLHHTLTKPLIRLGGVEVPEANVLFSGASPASVGVNEIVFRMPGGALKGTAISLTIEIGGVVSPPVTIATM